MNLLIADDELVIRKGMQSLDWKSIGLEEIYTAQNGAEAKELLLSCPIDLVIFDIRMPGMTGLELARMIQEYSMDTAVILLTGFAEFEYAREAMRYGVSDYLTKPLRPKEILAAVLKVKTELEQRRYQAKVIRKYEETIGASDTFSQIKKCFPKTSSIMTEILADMAKDYNQSISLSNYAEKYHFSKGYISKMFKKETAYSFMDLLNSIRLMNAALLLQDGEKIVDACEKTGFNDQRYFSQVFKKCFQCSPSEFKNKEVDKNSLKLKSILEKNHENDENAQ
ncbi:MAG: response regulator [Lachnospiraceae bacterium]|jgi:two-component system response regulator YesN|nr:response regulator [Lachnospiraceae bacterium]MDD3615734.1 response regulator [Lachnospiraceae bacterium]